MSDVTDWCRFVNRNLRIKAAPLMFRMMESQRIPSLRKIDFGHSKWHATFHRIEVHIVPMANKADWNVIADRTLHDTYDPFHGRTHMTTATNAQLAPIDRLWHQINPNKRVVVLRNVETYVVVKGVSQLAEKERLDL